MGTKMKGLLKGLRYISQMFDEQKDQEMQIGYPTDVKHVAHIGWDGPAVESPSWMKEFKSAPATQSAPLSINPEAVENPEIKWASGEANRRSMRIQSSGVKDVPDLPKSSRPQSSADGSSESEARDSSNKGRQSRRRHSKSVSKDSSDGTQPSRPHHDSPHDSGSVSRTLPDIPKKSRRKKAKDSEAGGSTRSRSRAAKHASSLSDPGSDSGSGSNLMSKATQLSYASSMKPLVQEEEKGCDGVY